MTEKKKAELEKRIKEFSDFHGSEITGIEEIELPNELTAVKLQAEFAEIVYLADKQDEGYLAYSHAHLLKEDDREEYDNLMMLEGDFRKVKKLLKPVDIYYIAELGALLLMPRNKKGIFEITERGIL